MDHPSYSFVNNWKLVVALHRPLNDIDTLDVEVRIGYVAAVPP